MFGILGGTFDPVHHAHLRLALEMLEGLSLDEVRLIPAREPPHRAPPVAPAEDRLEMLRAAVAGAGGLSVDTRELQRQGPSYTVDTLTSLREEFPDTPLCLIIGMDAFNAIDTWHRWQVLPSLAHIGIARRPGSKMPGSGDVAELLDSRLTRSPSALRKAPAGCIYVRDLPPLDISASRIRELLGVGRNPRYLLPDSVLDIIHQRGLYLASD